MTETERLVEPVSVCMLTLVGITLIFCQLAFFPIFSDNADTYFHSFLLFVPFACTALLISRRRYIVCSLVLGFLLLVHAYFMPLDYYEMMFQSPVLSIAFTCVGAFVMRFALRFVDERLKAQEGKPASFVLRYAASSGSLLVFSVLVSLFMRAMLFLLGDISGLSDPLHFFTYLGESVTTLSMWFQVIFNWFTWSIAALVSDCVVRRMHIKGVSESISAVFNRWLMVVVVGAFLFTTTISYCIETLQAMRVSSEALTNQVNFFVDQVSGYDERQKTLRKSEDDLVLGKAEAAANVIARDPSIAEDNAKLDELRDTLGLASLTVCDGNGVVVGDADGEEMTGFSFASNEKTKKYLDLCGDKEKLVEDVRNSVDKSGKEGDKRVFAGMQRLDAPGFVQVSVDAEEYAKALNEASVSNLASSYSYGQHGIVMISKDGKVVSSNKSDYLGQTTNEVFGLQEGTDDNKILYDELSSGEAVPMQDDENMSIMYLKAKYYNDYGVFVFASSEDIFANRTLSIALNTVCYMALFTGVFMLASYMLNMVVIKGFKRTNEALALITAGDLTQRIDERQTTEFDSLSDGINATVDALEGWIGEAERRMERDLATAKAIQGSALPSTFPPFPEIDKFDIYASMNAAKEVGGDFYDFFLIDDRTLGFLIADVSGKGIPGALFMMAAKTEIENYMSTGMPLKDAILTANYHLCSNNDAGMFVTVWAATLVWETGELTYVNAGHNFPLLRHGQGGEWEWLTKKCGLFLGTFETAKYRQETLTLEPGDELLLYTDGVNEAFNVDEEEYGNDRLEAFLIAHNDLAPQEIVRALRADVAAWAGEAEQSDDVTILALEYGTMPEVTKSVTVPAQEGELDGLRELIHQELGNRLCPLEAQNKIDIALEELFVNVCRYAYQDQNKVGSVEVTYTFTPSPSRLTVQLVDEGIPFDPLASTVFEPDGVSSLEDAMQGGLGLMMTKRSVDDLSYIRDGNKNYVVFTKSW